jgi:YidC/Oxa1 family membrane protein insertase
VKHEVQNISPSPLNPTLYLKLLRDSQKPKGESSFYFTYTGPVSYTEESKYKKIDFKDIESNKANLPQPAQDGYIAMAQHYFVSSWVLPKGIERQFFTQKENHLYSIGMQTSFGAINPQASANIESVFYVGPQLEKVLEKVTPGLELVKDYGWFTIFSKPLYWLLFELHKIIGNWGWSIIALVVLLKIALYWLNAKAYTSMARMKAVAPRVTELRERYKDNPMQMQQAMMKIYKEEKVNPMGGCLPMLVQIPVFIALYWVLLSSVEMRGAPWEWWIKDLSVPDPYFILPIIMTATTVLQTWLNPKPTDPMQEKLMWFMPLAFSVMFFFFPSGLVLYWITNNVLTIAQQWFINKRMGVLN